MRVLLDTHAFLWWVLDDPGLSADCRRILLEGLPIITADPAIAQYDVEVIW